MKVYLVLMGLILGQAALAQKLERYGVRHSLVCPNYGQPANLKVYISTYKLPTIGEAPENFDNDKVGARDYLVNEAMINISNGDPEKLLGLQKSYQVVKDKWLWENFEGKSKKLNFSGSGCGTHELSRTLMLNIVVEKDQYERGLTLQDQVKFLCDLTVEENFNAYYTKEQIKLNDVNKELFKSQIHQNSSFNEPCPTPLDPKDLQIEQNRLKELVDIRQSALNQKVLLEMQFGGETSAEELEALILKQQLNP